MTNRMIRTRLVHGWFTLVEVVFASLILASVFFGVFRMMASLQRTAQTETNVRLVDSVAADVRECLRSLVRNGLTGSLSTWNTYAISLGTTRTNCQKSGPYAPGASMPTALSLDYSGQNGTGSREYAASFKYFTGSSKDRIEYAVTDGSTSQNYVYPISH